MPTKPKTMIVTGAAKGIGAGVTNALIERGYNVVANSLNITTSTFAATERLAVVRGDIGDPSTAHEIVSTATKTFGSIDGVINNAGVYFAKPFTEYTVQRFRKAVRDKPARLYQHHAACRQANVSAKQRWERHLCEQRHGGAPYRWHYRFVPNGHQRRTRGDYAQPRHGICEGWNTVQRRRTRRCQYAYARKRFQRVLTEPFSDGSDI